MPAYGWMSARKQSKKEGQTPMRMNTYTGKRFDPMQMTPEEVSLRDIAHALSLLCRGGGHMKYFYTVGLHSLNCAREAASRGWSDRLVLACLLHDASECYMSDVPSPFKKTLPEYQEQEAYLLHLIYEKFLGSDLTAQEQAQLEEIDHVMLWYDLDGLLEKQDGEPPKLHIELNYTVEPFAKVEAEYIRIFEKYSRSEK